MVSSHPKNNESNDTRLTTYWAKTEHPTASLSPARLHGAAHWAWVVPYAKMVPEYHRLIFVWFQNIGMGEKFSWHKALSHTFPSRIQDELSRFPTPPGLICKSPWGPGSKPRSTEGQMSERGSTTATGVLGTSVRGPCLNKWLAWLWDISFISFKLLIVLLGHFLLWAIQAIFSVADWRCLFIPPWSFPSSVGDWAMLFIPSSRGVYNHDKNKTHDISWHI